MTQTKPTLEDRERLIRRIGKSYRNLTDPFHLLMGASIQKSEGWMVRRIALKDALKNAGVTLDEMLTQAMDGNADIDGILSGFAGEALWRLTKVRPYPLKVLPKALAMHAASKLIDLANKAPDRHRGTNVDDLATRDYFLLTQIRYACRERSIKPTKTGSKKVGRDSGCSIVAEATGLTESAVDEVWAKRKRFGIT
jgi:hypothetical protein